MTVAQWQIRNAVRQDRERALALMATAFGPRADALGEERWDWLFLRNTAGQRLVYLVADAGTVLAAQYALLPVRMQHAGGVISGLLSLDTATHPEFARRGLFTTLAQQLYASTRDDYPLVFGFPNSNSAPGFYRKLEWIEVRPYPLLMRLVGRLQDVVPERFTRAAQVANLVAQPLVSLVDVARLPRESASIDEFSFFDDWTDRLWLANAPRLGTCAVRDRAFLHWRYCESPFPYERLLLREGGDVRGFVIVAYAPSGRGITAHVMELMTTDPGDNESAGVLLASVVHRARRRGAAVISMIATPRHPHLATLRRAGLRRVPERWLGARSFGCRVNGALPGGADSVRHIDDWYLSGSDLDFI
jgi:hypothetical protein